MFNPAMRTSLSNKKNIGLFVALVLAVTLGFTLFSKSSLTGAAMMESGEVISFEPIFVFIAVIIVLILLSILWWWLSKK